MTAASRSPLGPADLRAIDSCRRAVNFPSVGQRGFEEEGTTTPFDMVVRNELDRHHLAGAAIEHVPKLGPIAAHARQLIRDKLIGHKDHVRRCGEDMPEIRDRGRPCRTAARAGDRRGRGT